MQVLHIHQDYPDGTAYPFTKAVANLIDAAQENDPANQHIVLSINRTSNPFRISFKRFSQGYSVVYWAVPVSFFYLPVIWLWAFVLFKKVNLKNIDIIHGHKLTTEGLFARYLANLLGKPFVVSVRGGSDSHNLKRLKFENNAFKKNAEQAKHIFWVSPWFQNTLEKTLDIQVANKSSLLANICNIDGLSFPIEREHNGKYFTVLSFHQYKRKGIIPLIEAIAELKKQGLIVALDIYGWGPADAVASIKSAIGEYCVTEEVLLKGHVEHQSLLYEMQTYKGFLLPAVNETFGMAYIEALATGNVILYVKKTGVDGFFNSFKPGVAINEPSLEAIKDAVLALETDFEQYHQEVLKIRNETALNVFTGNVVAENYNGTIRGLIS